MSKKEHISDKELAQDAPLLFGLDKKEIKAPEGYFDVLADSVMSKVETPIHQIKPASSLNIVWKVAAGIALLIGSYLLFWPVANPLPAELSDAEIHINLEQDMDYLLAIDDDILYEVLAEQMSSDESDDEQDSRIEFLIDEEIEMEDIIEVMNS